MTEEEQQDRGGMPGDGVGRREETGHSGVYPASGPPPPGDAEVRGQASWGRERGAEGQDEAVAPEVSAPMDESPGGVPGGSEVLAPERDEATGA
jgi:hypothetical protein